MLAHKRVLVLLTCLYSVETMTARLPPLFPQNYERTAILEHTWSFKSGPTRSGDASNLVCSVNSLVIRYVETHGSSLSRSVFVQPKHATSSLHGHNNLSYWSILYVDSNLFFR